MAASPIVAVDVGNARTKLGWFAGDSPNVLPEPRAVLHSVNDAATWQELELWLTSASAQSPLSCPDHAPGNPVPVGSPPADALGWWIGSVNRPATTRLLSWLTQYRPNDRVVLLAAGDLPLTVRLDRPDMVGIDRLLDAVAANYLRASNRPAVVIDVGSAITVDLVAADGAFLGGAILPGIAMAARALHAFTDLLPLIDMSELTTPPPALGSATAPAMRSGLFWGAVGALRELISRLAQSSQQAPQVFLTGGAGPIVAGLLGPESRHVPHLTLAGIALTAFSEPSS